MNMHLHAILLHVQRCEVHLGPSARFPSARSDGNRFLCGSLRLFSDFCKATAMKSQHFKHARMRARTFDPPSRLAPFSMIMKVLKMEPIDDGSSIAQEKRRQSGLARGRPCPNLRGLPDQCAEVVNEANQALNNLRLGSRLERLRGITQLFRSTSKT